MNIKTFPLQFTENKLEEIRKEAKKQDTSIKQFVLDAIDEKLKGGKK